MKTNNIHCCLDLELEQPKTNPQTPDSLLDQARIIQIGYVIYNLEPTFEVLKSKCINIDIGVPISQFIQKLTGINNDDIKAGFHLDRAYDMLIQDVQSFGASRVLKQWGGGDQDCLRAEVASDKLWIFGRSACNIKHIYQIYAEANGMNSSGGLAKSLKKLGLEWEGGAKHNALADALNTARAHDFLYRKLKK